MDRELRKVAKDLGKEKKAIQHIEKEDKKRDSLVKLGAARKKTAQAPKKK